MRTIISGRNIDVTDALESTIKSKLGKLDRFFNEELDAWVTLTVEKNRHIMEVTIPFNGSILRAEESTDDMYKSVDGVVSKLMRQFRKQKSRLENRYRGYETIRFENIRDDKEETEESKIVRTKRFAIKPMDPEEAVMQMELLGHDFFVYMDADTSDVNVVYKREDGHYGLIEPYF